MSKGTRLATASFAAAHESVDDDDSWRLSATQDPSRESSRRRRADDEDEDDDDAREGAAIGASRRGAGVFCSAAAAAALPPARRWRVLAPPLCSGCGCPLDLAVAGAGTRLVRGSEGMMGMAPQRGRRERERPGDPRGGQFGEARR